MDYLFTILIVTILILSNISIHRNKKIYKKYKLLVYLVLTTIILLLLLSLVKTKKKEHYQTGGSRDKRKKLLKKCGLPQNYNEVNHCFSDSTHHTCCKLGKKSLNYAKRKGNNIKDPAIRAYQAYLKEKGENITLLEIEKKLASDNLKIPWCTCSGSQVCSFYQKNEDLRDSSIKFVNKPNSDNIFTNVSENCEQKAASEAGIPQHLTPGINNNNYDCSTELSIQKI